MPTQDGIADRHGGRRPPRLRDRKQFPHLRFAHTQQRREDTPQPLCTAGEQQVLHSRVDRPSPNDGHAVEFGVGDRQPFACVMRLLPSYVKLIQRPLGDVTCVMFPVWLLACVTVTVLPNRSRIACSGATSPKTYTVPSLSVRSHPFPFQPMIDL